MEWKDPLNSFNSMKGLLYRDKFDAIKAKKLLAPVEVNIDPVNFCQLRCKWCNGSKIIDNKQPIIMDTGHLIKLIEYCAKWGVKGVCFAGGGEPTLHPDLGDALEAVDDNSMESAIITNGLFPNYDLLQTTGILCKWIGVSVDAGTKGTYEKLKGLDKFDTVCRNLKELADVRPTELTFKFLIHPGNQHEIFDACKIAKDLGCHRFHTRMLAQDYLGDQKLDLVTIFEQFDACHEFVEDDKFEVFTISHKQTDEGQKRLRFKKCNASPLLCMFEANGDVALCIDRKGDDKLTLCKHDDLKSIKTNWGTRHHFDLLNKVNPKHDCKKCTLGIYQELYDAYVEDRFSVNFP